MKKKILEVKGLETRFHTKSGVVHAVNGISYHLQQGETLAIVGESGSGKSVSLLSILGLIPQPPGEITAGQALFHGRDLLKLSRKELRNIRGKEISVIFQDPLHSLNPVLTVGNQISEMIQRHLGCNRKEAISRSIESLEMVQIPDPKIRIHNYPHQLSGGMRQRVMIAMALSCNPQILIADEPTTALDVTIQAQIIDLIRELHDRLGMSIIWITHDLGVVAKLADRVMVMYAGKIIEEGNVFDIYDFPGHPYTKGLLGSLPDSNDRSGSRLNAIDGSPLNLLLLPQGCPFAKRCKYVIEKCYQEYPPTYQVKEKHKVDCWIDMKSRKFRS